MTHADAPAEFIWAVPAYLSYLQPPLTPEVVAAAETTLGVRLPAAYLSLLQDRNGGYVRRVCPDSPHQMIWGVGPHFPTITDQPWRAVDDADADRSGCPPSRRFWWRSTATGTGACAWTIAMTRHRVTPVSASSISRRRRIGESSIVSPVSSRRWCRRPIM
jgi:hypothetical protein